MNESVRVYAPATVANLGPGFDILGMAVTEPGDIVTASFADQPGTFITRISGDNGRLPLNATQNTAGVAADHVRQQLAPHLGINLEIDKGLPLASGLGSSAASAVAAATAVNLLLGAPLSPMELLPAALEAEAAVSGRHADNVAPALLGGIVLVTGTTPTSLHPIPVGPNIANLSITLITPNVSIPTAEARSVLPLTVPFPNVVQQTRAVAQLVHALHNDNIELFTGAMMQDAIIELARKQLIPHFEEARDAAMGMGALAAVISGAGPTLCVVTRSHAAANHIGETLCNAYAAQRIRAVFRVVNISQQGAVQLL